MQALERPRPHRRLLRGRPAPLARKLRPHPQDHPALHRRGDRAERRGGRHLGQQLGLVHGVVLAILHAVVDVFLRHRRVGLELRQRRGQFLLRGEQAGQSLAKLRGSLLDASGFGFDALLDLLLRFARENALEGFAHGLGGEIRALDADVHAAFGDADDLRAMFEQIIAHHNATLDGFDAWAAVVMGTTLGMMLANAPVVWLGERIVKRVPISRRKGI